MLALLETVCILAKEKNDGGPGHMQMVDDMRSNASVDEKYEADDELPATGSDL